VAQKTSGKTVVVSMRLNDENLAALDRFATEVGMQRGTAAIVLVVAGLSPDPTASVKTFRELWRPNGNSSRQGRTR
jgi:hypothetical protein